MYVCAYTEIICMLRGCNLLMLTTQKMHRQFSTDLRRTWSLNINIYCIYWFVFYSSQPHVVHFFLRQSDYNYTITRAWTITIRCSKTSSHLAGGTRIPALNRSSLFSLKKVKCWEEKHREMRRESEVWMKERGLEEEVISTKWPSGGDLGGFEVKRHAPAGSFSVPLFSQTTLLRGGELKILLSEYCAQERMKSEILDNQMGAQSGGWPGWPQTHGADTFMRHRWPLLLFHRDSDNQFARNSIFFLICRAKRTLLCRPVIQNIPSTDPIVFYTVIFCWQLGSVCAWGRETSSAGSCFNFRAIKILSSSVSALTLTQTAYPLLWLTDSESNEHCLTKHPLSYFWSRVE